MRVIFFILGLIFVGASLYLLSVAVIKGGSAILPLFVLSGSLFVSASLFITAAGIIDAIKNQK